MRNPIPMRRYWFSIFLVAVMLAATTGALAVGYIIVHERHGDSPLGTVALVVAPATMLVGTLSTVLMSLLRDDKD